MPRESAEYSASFRGGNDLLVGWALRVSSWLRCNRREMREHLRKNLSLLEALPVSAAAFREEKKPIAPFRAPDYL